MNSELSSVIFEYEQILLNKEHSFTSSFDNDLPNEKIVAHLWKYVIEELLHWTPQQAANYLTMETVKEMHLKNTLKRIETPAGITYEKIPLYVLSLCYPSQIKYTIQSQVIDEYARVLADENAKFTKNYFDVGQALSKAVICLNYAISSYLSDLTINELYEFFADEKNAQEWLEKVKLIGVQKALFDTPLDFLHYTSYKNSNFLYLSYKLNCCVTY